MKPEKDQLPAILLTEPVAPVPAPIAARGQHTARRFVEFFIANIRDPNTRKAYYRAACEFFDWRWRAHESPRSTKLYDRTNDQITLDEVEKIGI